MQRFLEPLLQAHGRRVVEQGQLPAKALENRLDCLPESLCRVEQTEETLVGPQPALGEPPQEGRTDPLVLRRRLEEAQDDLLPLSVTPAQ